MKLKDLFDKIVQVTGEDAEIIDIYEAFYSATPNVFYIIARRTEIKSGNVEEFDETTYKIQYDTGKIIEFDNTHTILRFNKTKDKLLSRQETYNGTSKIVSQ